jgi:hypothetical protein
MAEKKDSPDFQDKIYTSAQPNLVKVADITGGEDSIKKDDYLTKFPGESDKKYKLRKEAMEYNDTPSQTIRIAMSKLYRKPLDFGENFPPELEEWVNNIDGNGTPLIEYAKKGTFPALRDGLVYSFVDVPFVKGIESMTDAQKKPFDLTPKLGLVKFIDVPNRRFDNKGNLTQITIAETVTRPDGDFMEKTIKQYRVLKNNNGTVTQQIWVEDEKKELVAQTETAISITTIPMAPFYAEFSGFHNAKPPLL